MFDGVHFHLPGSAEETRSWLDWLKYLENNPGVLEVYRKQGTNLQKGQKGQQEVSSRPQTIGSRPAVCSPTVIGHSAVVSSAAADIYPAAVCLPEPFWYSPAIRFSGKGLYPATLRGSASI